MLPIFLLKSVRLSATSTCHAACCVFLSDEAMNQLNLGVWDVIPSGLLAYSQVNEFGCRTSLADVKNGKKDNIKQKRRINGLGFI